MRDGGEWTAVTQEDIEQALRAPFRGAARVSLEPFLEAELDSSVFRAPAAATRRGSSKR